jgi:predicted nucleic acid-binding protein
MRLAVLDTNVIVSAGIRPDGAPARLVMDWILEGSVQVATCPLIVAEYRKVTQRKKFGRHDFPPLWLEFLIAESLYLSDPEPWPHPGPDPADLPFLALAALSGACLVTGNLRHFPEPIRGSVMVLSPLDYLDRLSQSTNPEP